MAASCSVGHTEGDYYRTACFKVLAVTGDGVEHELVDGGMVPWTQLLLDDNKERLAISGLGSERLCDLFPPRQPDGLV